MGIKGRVFIYHHHHHHHYQLFFIKQLDKAVNLHRKLFLSSLLPPPAQVVNILLLCLSPIPSTTITSTSIRDDYDCVLHFDISIDCVLHFDISIDCVFITLWNQYLWHWLCKKVAAAFERWSLKLCLLDQPLSISFPPPSPQFITSLIPCGKFGSPYLGKAKVAARAALPIPDSACGMCQDEGMAANAWDL